MGFFSTESALFVRNLTSIILKESFDVFMGLSWVGIVWLFGMYFYKLYFVYRVKAQEKDDKNYKHLYREMNKKSR